VLAGLTRRSAWLDRGRGSLSLTSGYRLWQRLASAQSGLRTRLSHEAPAPQSASHQPWSQLLSHLRGVVGESDDGFAAYQSHTQRGLFDP